MVMFMGVLIVLFITAIQPVLMVSFLIMLTLLYSLSIYMVMGSYWYSYALVMVMLSGVMVVFMYMVSMTPNESFEIYNLMFLSVFLLLMMFVYYGFYGSVMEMVSVNLWNLLLGGWSMFLILFLLEIMLMVVWLSDLSCGAVRVVWFGAWLKG